MEDDLVLKARLWRYGSYRLSGHRPEPSENKVFCVAIGPDKSICKRWINNYNGHWRHNPRPYGRAGRA